MWSIDGPCLQGAPYLAREIMNVRRLPECQLTTRHWQSDMDFLRKERVLVAWEGAMWGMQGGVSRGWHLSLNDGY